MYFLRGNKASQNFNHIQISVATTKVPKHIFDWMHNSLYCTIKMMFPSHFTNFITAGNVKIIYLHLKVNFDLTCHFSTPSV